MAQNVGALNADTNAIFEALRAKGVAVPANAQLSDVADMIESIEANLPQGLVLLEYFNKRYGAEKVSQLDFNVTYDDTCPLNIPGGAPTWYNGSEYLDKLVSYEPSITNQVCNSGNFTIELFCKLVDATSYGNTAPTAGFRKDSNDAWHAVFAPVNTGSTSVSLWILDSAHSISSISTYNWNHYAISSDNGMIRGFINGTKVYEQSHSIASDYSGFKIWGRKSNRAALSMSQVALWNYCKYDSDFTVDTNPIYYI
jgi:hypothetical protein